MMTNPTAPPPCAALNRLDGSVLAQCNRVIGTVEREAALEMAAARPSNHLITLGADKAMMWPTLSPICGSSM